MSHFDFSIANIIIKAWRKFKESSFFWIVITLFNIALIFAVLFIPLAGLFNLLFYYFSASITLMSIKYMRDEFISFNDLFSINSMKFLHYLAISVLVLVLTILGLALFIFPGLYIMLRLMFAQYLILDNDIGFDEAIKKSWYLTKGHELSLFGFLCAMFIIAILGAIFYFLGLLIALPLIQLSTAYLYLSLNRSLYKFDSYHDSDKESILF